MNGMSTPEPETMTATDPSSCPEEDQHATPRQATVEDCPEDHRPTELPQASSPSVVTNLSVGTHGSGSSSGSGSTVTRVPPVPPLRRTLMMRRRHTMNGRNTNGSPAALQQQLPVRQQSPRQRSTGDVLQYLDADSPPPSVPQYNVRHPGEPSTPWKYGQHNEQISPTAQSSSSSGNGSFHSDLFSDPACEATTDRSWSPEQVVVSGPQPLTNAKVNLPFTATSPGQQPRYSMYQNSPNQGPGMPPFAATTEQRGVPAQSPGAVPFPFNQTPLSPIRAPLSGYQLVAAKLSGEIGSSPVTPIYRRFETLNHRLLLYLQDEISELEERLESIDATETHKRFRHGRVFPASRRQEAAQGAEQQQYREILGFIGYKMTQYNQVLTSFKEAQRLPTPTLNEVQQYRAFLATQKPISKGETRFLDAEHDLVSLGHDPNPPEPVMEDLVTPMPRSFHDVGFPPSRRESDAASYRSHQESIRPNESLDVNALRTTVLGMLVAILVPILTFAVIPGFVGRMTVVLLVGVGVLVAVAQSGLFGVLAQTRGSLDFVLAVGVYGGIMAVIAGAFD